MAGILFGLSMGVDYGCAVHLGILAGNCCGPVELGMGSLDRNRFFNEARKLLKDMREIKPKKVSPIIP